MDFALSPEEQKLVQSARAFVRNELLPLEPQLAIAEHSNSYFPDDDTLENLKAKAKERGLWGLQTPREFGGADLSAIATALITIETGKTFVPFDYGGFAPHALFACNADQRERYLLPVLQGKRHFCLAMSEPGAGSDATSIKTTAVKCAEGWRINGAKSWISFGDIADFAILLAVTDPEKRQRGGITAFLVDRKQGWTSKPSPTMLGNFRQHSFNEAPPAELHFDDVMIPENSVLGSVGEGFRLAMTSIGGGGRLRLPAYSVGHAERLVEMAIAHIRNLQSEPAWRDEMGFRSLLADCAVDLQAAKWLTLHAAWKVGHGDARAEISMAKLAGPQMIWRVIDNVMQILGPIAFSKDLPIERLLRQVRVYRIFAGSDEVQMMAIARAMRTETHFPLW
jgi:acyl-CoA dehydrogenase